MRFLRGQMRFRSAPVDPIAFPMCSSVLSLDACRSRCKSYVVRCALARQLSIQLRALWPQVCSRSTPVDRFDICSVSCVNRFCLDLDQAIFEPRYARPKSLQICFQMASFGRLFVQIWIKPLSSPHTHPQNHCRFASTWLHSVTLPSRSGSGHLRSRRHLPEDVADLLPGGFLWIPFCPDLDQAIFE